MSTTALPTSVTLPPGRYVVGDPCYVFEAHERWMRWLDAARFREVYATPDHPDILIAEIDGHVAVGVGTAHGDGTYKDGLGNEFGVDAGLIGLVPIEIADLDKYPDTKVFLDVTEPLLVEPAEDGVITLGPHVIPTEWEDDEDEEETCFDCGEDASWCSCDEDDDEDEDDL